MKVGLFLKDFLEKPRSPDSSTYTVTYSGKLTENLRKTRLIIFMLQDKEKYNVKLERSSLENRSFWAIKEIDREKVIVIKRLKE